MTSLLEELQQRAATLVETAYETAADATAEEAFNAGYEKGRRDGFNEAVDIIDTTREAFGVEDDECDCPICKPEDGVEIELVGDYEQDFIPLTRGLSLMCEDIALLAEQAKQSDLAILDGVEDSFKIFARGVSSEIEQLEAQSLADDLVLEALNERLRVIEEALGINKSRVDLGEASLYGALRS